MHCYELAQGVTNLARYRPNVTALMRHGALKHLLKIIEFKDSRELECGLNAMWSLVTSENRRDIIRSGTLTMRLQALAEHRKEGVKQAAIRLLMRLVDYNEDGESAVLLVTSS